MRMTFSATQEQYSELEGLAYWISRISRGLEENDGETDPEIESMRKTVNFIFDRLDEEKVPFWVQNSVLAWAEVWRNTKQEYFSEAMKKRGIIRANNEKEASA